MTVLNFPASPSNGDTYEENGVVYTWNGSYWSANNATDLGNIYVAIAGDRMTGNLELPGGGGDTAALQKQEIQLMVDAGGGGGTGPTDLYWERDAGALSPKVSTDNVDIGDGNIVLNADGSITAAGDVKATGFDVGEGATSDESFAAVNIFPAKAWAIKIEDDTFLGWGNSNSYITGNGTNNTLSFATNGNVIAELDVDSFNLGDIQNDDLHISLNADGSASFNSTVQTGTSSLTGEHSIVARNNEVNNATFVAIQYDSAGTVFSGRDGSVSTSLSTSKIEADGSMYIGGNCDDNPPGSFAPNIKLNADGSATFTGDLTLKSPDAIELNIERTGQDVLSAGIDNDGPYLTSGTHIGFRIAGGDIGDETVRFKTDGSATFAGSVKSNSAVDDTTEGVFLDPKGAVFVTALNSNAEVFRIWLSGTQKVTFFGDGRATFKGTVTAPNVFFNLEAEDPTKYTTEVDEEGNETQAYIGATLDVKESIETAVTARAAMRETFQELLVAVQSATDFGELKSAMLVALEDYA